jgi:hypothetical protein
MERCQLVESAQNDSLSPETWCRLQFSDRNTLNLSEAAFLGTVSSEWDVITSIHLRFPRTSSLLGELGLDLCDFRPGLGPHRRYPSPDGTFVSLGSFMMWNQLYSDHLVCDVEWKCGNRKEVKEARTALSGCRGGVGQLRRLFDHLRCCWPFAGVSFSTHETTSRVLFFSAPKWCSSWKMEGASVDHFHQIVLTSA